MDPAENFGGREPMTRAMRSIAIALLALGLAASRAAGADEARLAGDPAAVRAALERREFDVLERELLAARERRRAVHGSPDLERLVDAFRKLAPPEARALYAWSHEDPRSAAARVALASHYLGEAWRARGTRFARDTSSESLARMRDFCVRAAGAADEALTLAPDWIDAYRLRMEAARLAGDEAGERSAFAAALAIAPDDYAVRREHARGLTPRWGGDYEALDAFAAESQAFAKQNPRLVLLLGMSDADRGEILSGNEHYEQAVAALDRALLHGEEPGALADRGWTLYRLKRYDEAYADVTRALALEPGNPRHHVRLAALLTERRQFEDALGAYDEASRLDPFEPYYRNARAELQTWMTARKRHEELEAKAPLLYAAYRASWHLLRHAGVVAAAAVCLWLGWRAWMRRRGVSRREGAKRGPSGAGWLLLQSYAWLILAYHASLYTWAAVQGTSAEAEDYADVAVTGVALVGVLAFAHGWRVVHQDLWRAMALAFPAWNLAYQLYLEGGSLALVGTWLPIHVMLLPSYASLFLYAYRSEGVWARSSYDPGRMVAPRS